MIETSCTTSHAEIPFFPKSGSSPSLLSELLCLNHAHYCQFIPLSQFMSFLYSPLHQAQQVINLSYVTATLNWLLGDTSKSVLLQQELLSALAALKFLTTRTAGQELSSQTHGITRSLLSYFAFVALLGDRYRNVHICSPSSLLKFQ